MNTTPESFVNIVSDLVGSLLREHFLLLRFFFGQAITVSELYSLMKLLHLRFSIFLPLQPITIDPKLNKITTKVVQLKR